MKIILVFLISFILILGPGGQEVCHAQAFATGHITAEVIESVSASSQAITNISSDLPLSNTILNQGTTAGISSVIKLGGIIVNSGDMVTVDVVQNSISFSNSKKANIQINNNLYSKDLITTTQTNSSRILQKVSLTNIADSIPYLQNSGSYTIVFACN